MKVVIKECLKRFELIRFIRIRCEYNLVDAQQKVDNIENEPIIVNVLDSDLAYLDCICKNENTAHLVGTNEPYKEPEPKVWRVVNSPASFDEMYSDEELSNFIKTAVINNKDITNFHVMYIPNN